MDKKSLEHQYSPSRWSKVDKPDEIITKHVNIITEESKDALEHTQNEIDVQYGDKDGQKLDIFYDSGVERQDFKDGKPVLVFIHGGYWQELGKEYYSYIGKTFANHGIISVIVGYDLAPKVKLATIFDEIKESLLYLNKRFPSSHITIIGHSAGAHLAALLLKFDWTSVGLKNPIKAIVPISGVFDLRPLVTTYINEPLKMDENEAWLMSPMHYIEDMKVNSSCRVLCVVAEQESPEFHRQSKEFYQMLQEAGFDVQFKVIMDTDHFSIMHSFANKDFELIQHVVGLVNDTRDTK